MRKLLLLLFVFVFQSGVYAQDHHFVDSIRNLIETSKVRDTNTVISYLRIANQYTWNFPDTAIQYFQKAYLLSTRLQFRPGLLFASWGEAYPLALVREDSAAVAAALRS